MKEEIKKAIKALTAKATETKSADEALKFTQASLNAAHVLATLDNLKN